MHETVRMEAFDCVGGLPIAWDGAVDVFTNERFEAPKWLVQLPDERE